MDQKTWEISTATEKRNLIQTAITSSTQRGYITDTPLGASIVSQQIMYIEEELEILVTKRTRGMGGKYTSVLRQIAGGNYYTIAYIGLTTTLDSMFSTRKRGDFMSIIAQKIGIRLEQEHLLQQFEEHNEDILFSIRNDLLHSSYKGQTDKAIHRIQLLWEADGQAWNPWGTALRGQVGARVLRGVLRVLEEYIDIKDYSYKNRREHRLVPTEQFTTFIDQYMEYYLGKSVISPPCIEPPVPWRASPVGIIGGFHTLPLSQNHPFIRTKLKKQRDYIASNTPHQHIAAVNRLQSVEWEINSDVLALIIKSVKHGTMPDHLPRLEKLEYPDRPDDDHPERKAWGMQAHKLYKINRRNTQRLLRVRKVIELAKQFENRSLWFVWTCDFRGRVYPASSYLSPHGPDYVKSLLRFKEGKALGSSGLFYLAVHGANCYGLGSTTDLYKHQWCIDNAASIRAVARAPESSSGRSFLAGASKPFAFYAFAREWAAAHESSAPHEYVSHLPVATDGSANGYQHFAALLRDEKGAEQVNLTNTKVPTDIYASIAKQLTSVFANDPHSSLGKGVLQGIDRSFVKGPVLAIPYGITLRGISLAIEQYINQNSEQFGLEVGDLNNWEIINTLSGWIIKLSYSTVPKAKLAMRWFGEVALQAASKDEHLHWLSPVKFPVMQPYAIRKQIKLKSQLLGNRIIHLDDKPSGVRREKSRVSIAPNFIHSMDASHLVRTINNCPDLTFSTAHDEYSCHAADRVVLHRETRYAFKNIYVEDVLEDFATQVEEYAGPIQTRPELGTYDINEVINAKYFFG